LNPKVSEEFCCVLPGGGRCCLPYRENLRVVRWFSERKLRVLALIEDREEQFREFKRQILGLQKTC